jgi:tetratricopeptide (TPR) repeat protein
VLYTQGNYEEAIKCFDKALELNPYHVETLKIKELFQVTVEIMKKPLNI